MSLTQSEPTGTEPGAVYHRVSAEQLRPSPGALALTAPGHQARHLECLPLVADGAKVVVAFASAPSSSQIDEHAALTGRGIAPVPSDADALADAMLTAYPPLTAAATASDRTNAAIAAGARVPENLDELLVMVMDEGASDLHLVAGAVPAVPRANGRLMHLSRFAPLTPAVIERLAMAAVTEGQEEAFARDLELDTSYTLAGVSRFRMNVFRQRNSVGAVLRAIPFDIPELDSLGMPPVVRTLADLPRGLVLVTGPTGSGKSTTLAALIDVINRDKEVHILTVEDPIEFLAQPSARHREPARSRPRHPQLRQCLETSDAGRPRRHPHRRDARPRDDPDGPHRGRNRSPGLRDAAHAVRTPDHRPHRRRFSTRAAGPDPSDAVDDASGGRNAAS